MLSAGHGADVIRVGFTFSFVDDEWLGGLNYFRSLFSAVLSLPERKIEPVILLDSGRGTAMFDDFPSVTIIKSSIFGSRSKWGRLQWLTYRCFERDLVVAAMLKWHGISVLSHSYRLGYGARLPAIGWIPDFQHVYLPEFFQSDEIDTRNNMHAALAAASDRVVLSSRCAQEDFRRLHPRWEAKSRVLPFVAEPVEDPAIPSQIALAERYRLAGRYFLVANQFWAHKNHRLIIDALRILKSRGLVVPVLATGKSSDYRWPDFFDGLMRYAKEQNVLDCFRVLGVIPRPDLVGLMKHAVAVLNPSRFEGWSTSIEEAKALGVRVIASDIPVHREQEPPGALYVDPDRPEQLAAAMSTLWTQRDGSPPPRTGQSVAERREAFARAYQDIVLEVCAANRSICRRRIAQLRGAAGGRVRG
jgi:glycosyltransferase involved in cell wall biosynthesis